MSDFRDVFEAQLIIATRREALALRGAPRRLRLPVTMARRRLLAIAAAAVGAAAAAAATQPWTPLLGSSSFHEAPPTASATAPPIRQLELLGVLRRVQTAEDRAAAMDGALVYLTGATSTGIRTAYVRSVDGGRAVLIPAASVISAGRRIQDALCMFFGDPTGDGGGRSCWSTSDIEQGRARGKIGDLIYGLVPDGVARVRLGFDGGLDASATVQDNFFAVRGPGRRVQGGGEGAPVVTSVVWLDGAGFPAGPPVR